MQTHTPEGYRLISDGQWRYLHGKINTLTDLVHDTRNELRDTKRPKRYLRFNELLPPASVCRDVVSMMIGVRSFDGFVGRLADYYQCETMGCRVDETISPKVIAQYRPSEKSCYSREKTSSKHTVLHEFYHHLEHEKVVIMYEDREKKADRFATAFLRRALQ